MTPLRAAAIGVPLLALAGFAAAGGTTADIMSDPDALAALKLRSNWPTDADGAVLQSLRDAARLGFAALLISILCIHAFQLSMRWRKSEILVNYVSGPTITLKPGMSLLEGSRAAGIPHASVCGGRARCSTCRVKVESGLEALPPPGAAEAVTLQSIEAPANVRLACQLRPLSSLTIAIVTPPGAPGPPGGDFLEMKSAVAAHVRALVSQQLVDLASSDQDVLGRYIGSKAGSPVAINLDGNSGCEIVGAREDVLLDRPAIAIVFKHGSKLITLFVLPNPDADAVAVRGQRNGYHVLSWSDAQFAYCAVSDLETDELDKLEQSFSLVKALDGESRTQ